MSAAARLGASLIRSPLGIAWMPLGVALMLMGTLSVVVQAQFDYTVDQGGITLTGYEGPGGDLKIPSLLDGLPVTAIAAGAFYNHAGLTAVSIPDSVTSVGIQAFLDCPDLVTATLGKGVTNLQDANFGFFGTPFNGCTNLVELKVAPENPAYTVVDGVLFDKGQTRLILYPPGKAATSHAIPDSVTNIVGYAYFGCNRLIEVKFGKNVVSLGRSAFSGCEGLSQITFGPGLRSIGDSAFANCSSLSGVLDLGNVSEIGESAFGGCTNLTGVNLPGSVTAVGADAFEGCDHLEAFAVAPGNPAFSARDGVLFDLGQTRLVQYPGGKAGDAYLIPGSVKEIGEGAFGPGIGPVSLIVPATVTNLASAAFAYCASLKSITLAEGVTAIPDSTFVGCSGLTNVAMSSQVRSIGMDVFAGCDGLTSITIPAGVTSIGNSAFGPCTNLAKFEVDAANVSFAAVDGVLFDRSRTELVCYPGGKEGTVYAVPDGVTGIGESGFGSAARLGHVLLPDSLRLIGSFAFAGCASLVSIDIPRAAAIDYFAFVNCPSLTGINVAMDNPYHTSVDGVLFDKLITDLLQYPAGKKETTYTIPQGVGYLWQSAFYGSKALNSVTVPDTVWKILPDAFEGCTALTRVYFEGSAPVFQGAVFYRTPATIYHRPDTGDWPASIGGRPVVSWNPAILTADGRLGLSAGHFGFTITGASGVPLIVEASDNLAQPNWAPVNTNICDAQGLAQFSDPAGAGGVGRFYRFRPQ